MPLHDELRRLRVKLEDAYGEWTEAKRAREQDGHLAARTVVAGVAALRDSIVHRQPDAPAPEDQAAREREETVTLCRAVEANPDLVLGAVGTSDDLRITDLSIERRFREADLVLTRARGAVASFEGENAAGLKGESDKAALDGIRDAFARDDLDAVKAGLAG
jgi:hypothetical protein